MIHPIAFLIGAAVATASEWPWRSSACNGSRRTRFAGAGGRMPGPSGSRSRTAIPASGGKPGRARRAGFGLNCV